VAGVWVLSEDGMSSAAEIVIGITSLVLFGVSIGLSHLIAFHIYLKWNGMSTYNYILRKRGYGAKITKIEPVTSRISATDRSERVETKFAPG
jgi:hypothetical protein